MPVTDTPGRSEGRRATLTELGRRVAARRTELGLSLASVADAVGVHHSTLSRLERGQQDLGASHLPMLAQALDISVSDLFPSRVTHVQCALTNGSSRKRSRPTRPLSVDAFVRSCAMHLETGAGARTSNPLTAPWVHRIVRVSASKPRAMRFSHASCRAPGSEVEGSLGLLAVVLSSGAGSSVKSSSYWCPSGPSYVILRLTGAVSSCPAR